MLSVEHAGSLVGQRLFRCPECCEPLALVLGADHLLCARCAKRISVIEGVPILVRDRAAIEGSIREALKSGRAPWYEAPHAAQWEGPYRHHLWKRRRYVESILAARRAVDTGQPVGLDLGCGDGVNMLWLERFFSGLYGSDYNFARLIRASRLLGPHRVVMADVTDYPAIDGAFDVVFLNHVLEHVKEDERALAELFRILKPSGLAIVGVPNEGALFWQLAYRLQPRSRATTDHVHFYTTRSLVEKCQRAGFTVESIYPIGWGIPHWSLDSLLRRFEWVDDLLERLGRTLLPSQATSLYVTLRK